MLQDACQGLLDDDSDFCFTPCEGWKILQFVRCGDTRAFASAMMDGASSESIAEPGTSTCVNPAAFIRAASVVPRPVAAEWMCQVAIVLHAPYGRFKACRLLPRAKDGCFQCNHRIGGYRFPWLCPRWTAARMVSVLALTLCRLLPHYMDVDSCSDVVTEADVFELDMKKTVVWGCCATSTDSISTKHGFCARKAYKAKVGQGKAFAYRLAPAFSSHTCR